MPGADETSLSTTRIVGPATEPSTATTQPAAATQPSPAPISSAR
jgi:hypothetical protein